jgi:hypothetical protein
MAKKINVPWKQVFKLNKDVNGVECWNLSKRDGSSIFRQANWSDWTMLTTRPASPYAASMRLVNP